MLLSSIAGITNEKGKLDYSVSKAALIKAAKILALELGKKQIRVNSISPAMVQTPMLLEMFENLPEDSVADINRRHLFGILDTEDVANLCIFLLSDLSKRITGTNIVIDSGFSL